MKSGGGTFVSSGVTDMNKVHDLNDLIWCRMGRMSVTCALHV